MPIRSVVGLIPEQLAACVGVFVDARSLACRVQFVLLPPVSIRLGQILDLIGALRPDVGKIKAVGLPAVDGNPEVLMPEHAAVLTLTVA